MRAWTSGHDTCCCARWRGEKEYLTAEGINEEMVMTEKTVPKIGRETGAKRKSKEKIWEPKQTVVVQTPQVGRGIPSAVWRRGPEGTSGE